MHLSEDQLVLIYYGEAPRDRHLDECAVCRDELANLGAVLNTIAADPVPAPRADLAAWAGASALPRRVLTWRRVAVPAAIAAMLLIAFQLGRHMPVNPPAAAPVREGVLLVALPDHLERSRILLAEIANAPRTGEPGLGAALAEDLLESNRLLRHTAALTGEAQYESVLDDLERFLLEVAHTPEHLRGESLTQLQSRLESQGLLFRIRIVETRLRAQQDTSLEDRL